MEAECNRKQELEKAVEEAMKQEDEDDDRMDIDEEDAPEEEKERKRMHVCDFALLSKTGNSTSSKSSSNNGVEVALDSSDHESGIGLYSSTMAAKYEQTSSSKIFIWIKKST
ncbi:uncharacterized protein LOC142597461 [Dermatophagoides farinae]|uniref:uncharacterized protein LOC142597461 n=1 Tax=Dermatophagoides farinae TaxID=6954 RepID=UPI003F60F766